MQFRFPNLDGEQFDIPIGPGRVVFVIGANGTGKSSLMQRLFTQNSNEARRISAHRQTWLQSNAMDISAATKRAAEQNMLHHDARDEARWMDHNAMQRAGVTIFELIDSENVRARKITAALDAGDSERVRELRREEAPLTVLNELLKIANLSIDISIETDEQLFARRDGGDPYSIAELSDGERNAVLIAANVLTAKPGTLIIIDEPERHLHRAIVSPLLLSLFEKRDDCAFVISTHDVSLPLDRPEASTLLVRSCRWSNRAADGWDADLLTPETTVSDDVRFAILGSRRRILFVEGEHDSLDRHIYTILYDGLSVAPHGNCTEVERAVTGITNSHDLHWVAAFGLIDRDDREPAEIEALRARGVYALECYSVESLYYCDVVMHKIAERQAEVAEGIADLAAARQAILDGVAPHRERLCTRLVGKQARNRMMKQLPAHQDLQINPVQRITYDASKLFDQEYAKFDALVQAADTDGLVSRYPVRETQALANVASRLGFQNREKYESAVRKLLIESDDARSAVKQKLRALTEAVEA